MDACRACDDGFQHNLDLETVSQPEPAEVPPPTLRFLFDFVRDYSHEITRGMRKRSLLMSLFGYLLYIFIVLLLYYLSTDAAHVYDLETLGNKLAQDDTDEWQQMHTLGDFWNWFQYSLLPQYHQQAHYVIYDSTGEQIGVRDFADTDLLGPLHMYGYNLIVGALRIQQKRVKKDDCSIPSQSYRSGDHCWTSLSADTEEQESFVGPSSGTTYHFSEDDVGTWWGTIPGEWASYGPGGFNADFSPNQTIAQYTDQMNELKNDIWLGHPTRMVTITINSYNAGANMWSNNQLQFEFSASGIIYKKIQSRTFTTGYSATSESDSPPIVLKAVLFWITMHYLINSMLSIFYDARRCVRFGSWVQSRRTAAELAELAEGHWLERCWNNVCCRSARATWHSLDVWRTMDFLIAALMLTWLGIHVNITYKKDDFIPEMATDDFVDTSTIASMVAVANQMMVALTLISHCTLQHPVILLIFWLLQGFVFFVMMMKLFKYMAVNKKLAVIWQTFVHARRMLIYFCFQFGVLFMAFAFWGHVSFGTDLEAFATPVTAVNTAVDMLLGNGDLFALYKANRVMGPLYYFLFTVVMTLIIVNVFIAIISDSYSAAAAETVVQTAFSTKILYNKPGSWIKGTFWGLVDYGHKLVLVLTLNLCFSSPVGLSLEPTEVWGDTTFGRRVALVLKSCGVYLLELVFLCTVRGIKHKMRWCAGVDVVYSNRLTLTLALAHLEELHPQAGQMAVDVPTMVRLFGPSDISGELDGFIEQYKEWNGPSSQRFQDGSPNDILKSKMRTLSKALAEIKSHLKTKMLSDQIDLTPFINQWDSQKVNHTVDWHTNESEWTVVGTADFPFELMEWHQDFQPSSSDSSDSPKMHQDSHGVLYEGELVNHGRHQFVDSGSMTDNSLAIAVGHIAANGEDAREVTQPDVGSHTAAVPRLPAPPVQWTTYQLPSDAREVTQRNSRISM